MDKAIDGCQRHSLIREHLAPCTVLIEAPFRKMAAGKQRATLAWISTEADSPRAVRLLRARRHLVEALDIELRACWRPFHDEEIAPARADCCRT